MRFRILGRTGLNVSEISLGTAEIGLDYGIGVKGIAPRPSEAEAALLLNRALDLGVNFVDTARVYGESEAIIGRVLKERRGEFLICSKVLTTIPGNSTADPGLREFVTASVNYSLRALNVAHIEILMIHSASTETIARGEAREIFEELKREGKVHWIGASIYEEEGARMAIESGEYDCLQIAYNILDRRSEAHILVEAEAAGVGIVARSVLLKGVLTERRCSLPESMEALRLAADRLDALAENAGMSLPEMAYRYVLTRGVPHTALTGAASIRELESAVEFGNAGPLPPELNERIRDIEIADVKQLNPSTWPVG